MEAGSPFRLHGFDKDFLRSLERRILSAIQRGKALFFNSGDHKLSAYEWLIDVTGRSVHPVYRLNRLSIAAGWGAVFCALTPGAGRRNWKAGTGSSHNKPSARIVGEFIDSG